MRVLTVAVLMILVHGCRDAASRSARAYHRYQPQDVRLVVVNDSGGTLEVDGTLMVLPRSRSRALAMARFAAGEANVTIPCPETWWRTEDGRHLLVEIGDELLELREVSE